MRTPRAIAALVFLLSCGLCVAACTQSTATPRTTATEDIATEAIDDDDVVSVESTLGESAHQPANESTAETHPCLGWELPSPGPSYLPPDGHDPGGPGYGWGGGWGADPQYAPYVGARDPDPYKAQREAKQREYDRIRAENRGHGGGGQNRPIRRRYSDHTLEAPDADRVPESVHKPQHGDGPLDDKARCLDECWEAYLVDTAHYRRIRDKEARHQCWVKASDDLSLCNRECSRKYPGK